MMFFIVLSIPLMLSQYLLVRRAYTEVRDQAMEDYGSTPERFCAGFHALLEKVHALGYKARSDYRQRADHRLSETKIAGHPYRRVEAVEVLGDYLKMLPDARSVGVHFDGGEYVVTSDASYTVTQYIGRLSGYNTAKFATYGSELYRLFGGEWTVDPCYFSTFNGRNNGSFLILGRAAINAGRGTDYNAVLLYEFTEDAFEPYVGTNYTGESCGMAIYQDEILLWHNRSFDRELTECEAFTSFLANTHASPPAGDDALKLTEGDVSVFKKTDASLGLTFVTTFPEQEILRSANQLYRNFNIAMLVVFLCLTLIAGAAVMISYQPVRALLGSLKPERDDQVSGEFSTIHSAFDTLREENQRMSEEAAEQKLLLTEYIFANILQGTVLQPSALKQFDAAFTHKHCAVAVVEDTALNNTQRESISRALEDATGAKVLVMETDERQLAICFGGDEHFGTENLLDTLRDIFATLPVTPPEFGIGTKVEDINRLRVSYREALFQLQERRQRRNKTVRESARSEIQRFTKSLQAGASDDAMLDDLFEKLLQPCSDSFERRLICYELLNAYLQTLETLRISQEKSMYNRLISFCTEDELRQALKESTAVTCEAIRAQIRQSVDRRRQQFIEYIDRRFMTPDLTLTELADAFGISIYACSRQFRELVGIGFKEYTAARRLEYARELLMTTDLNIGEIAEHSGFCSPSYFISRFKSAYGISPNKFRDV
jgi:AraC-like DNA-binding protein